MPWKIALLVGLLLAGCEDGPVLRDSKLERGTALAPPGVSMLLPPPVSADQR